MMQSAFDELNRILFVWETWPVFRGRNLSLNFLQWHLPFRGRYCEYLQVARGKELGVVLHFLFCGDITFYGHSLPAAIFVTRLEYPPSPPPGYVIFEWSHNLL